MKFKVSHEKTVAASISYLELVLAGLSLRRRVEKVDGENLDSPC